MRIATIIFLIFALVNICTDFVKADFKDCVQERLLKVLQRVSGPDTNQRITISAPKSVHQLTREQSEVLTPTLSAEGPNGKKLEFRIVGLKEFEKIANILKRKGIWIFLNTSSPDARLATGHFSVIAGESYFDRLPDNYGAQALTSAQSVFDGGKLQLLSNQLAQGKFVAAQFFEISEKSGSKLEKFYHDRVWFFHENKAPYKTQFVDLPNTRKGAPAFSENCATFSLCFMSPKWLELRPELKDVQEEMGSMSLSQIPSLQLYNNLDAPSYRSTFIIGENPEELEKLMLVDGLKSDADGHQLLLKSAPIRIQDPKLEKTQ
ncbi:MAG: hypothetical protein AABZ55_15155 [Bdellovibrionota bacterium]